jgi:hypothetical protein
MKKKEGKKWVVRAKSTGKVLGTHKTEAAAQKQLAAIEISKKRSKKRRKYDKKEN